MIRKFSKLEYIGKFISLMQEKDFWYGTDGSQNCNIIFGFNGSGKTTLSNALSFFADKSFINDNEKMAIFNDIKNGAAATVELELQDRNSCKYPANQHDKNIYVFNSNFIVTHVFDGTKGKIKNFSNAAGGEIKNPAIDEANQKIAELEVEKKRLEVENAKLDDTLKAINKDHSSQFNKMLTDKNKKLTSPNPFKEILPNETLDELQQKIICLATDYDLSKKQRELADDLACLEKLVFYECNLNLLEVGTVLNKSILQLSKEVFENKIKYVKDLFADETCKQKVENWFKFAKNILGTAGEHGGQIKCPICDTDISDRLEEILKNFGGYFDKGYEDFILQLQFYKEQSQIAISLLNNCETNASILGRLLEKYKTQITGQTFATFDFKTVKLELETILNACDSKLANIQFSYTIQKSAVDSLSRVNVAIKKFDDLKNNSLSALRAKKLDTGKIEDEIRSVYKKFTLLKFDQFGKGGNLEKYKQNHNRIAIISTPDFANVNGLLFYQNKRRDELKKMKIESKSISKFLKILGIDHFVIDIKEDAPDENIIIKYSSSGTDKNKLRNCLSDGEKTALAFAYFLSKFENERGSDDKRKESVVVIDDPVSSLDENRLYSTAYLIRDYFKSVRQLIVMSHNFLFLKFFNSLYSHNTNCLFINDDKLSDLPEELKNFESPYFYMLKGIIDFSLGTNTDYQNAKKYLPNFIRRVLETFLSFKFAKIISRPNGKRSPGLNEFDTEIDSLNIPDSLKQNLKHKIANIAKVTDQHSHGNAQLTEENFYISEDELKLLAHNAVAVIDCIDNVHKSSTIK